MRFRSFGILKIFVALELLVTCLTQWLEIADTGLMTTNTDTDYRYNLNTIAEQLFRCQCSNSSQKLTHAELRVPTSTLARVLDDHN